MTVSSTPVEDGRLATWEEFEDFVQGDVRAEYIDGRIVLMGDPSEVHQELVVRLLLGLRETLPDSHRVLPGWGWKPTADWYCPDLIVYSRAESTTIKRFLATPALCVEVLSSNRRHDLVLKMTRYAAAGLPRYWVVDPREQTVTTYRLEPGEGGGHYWPTDVLHRGDTPRALDLGVATLTLDVTALFAD